MIVFNHRIYLYIYRYISGNLWIQFLLKFRIFKFNGYLVLLSQDKVYRVFIAFMAYCIFQNGLYNIPPPPFLQCNPSIYSSRGGIYLFTHWIWVSTVPNKIQQKCLLSVLRIALNWSGSFYSSLLEPTHCAVRCPNHTGVGDGGAVYATAELQPRIIINDQPCEWAFLRCWPTWASAVCQQHVG